MKPVFFDPSTNIVFCILYQNQKHHSALSLSFKRLQNLVLRTGFRVMNKLLYLSKQAFFLFFLLACLPETRAQLSDNFDDGEFRQNPVWQGDTALFSIIDGRLALDDPAPASSNEAYLSVFAPTSADTITRWEFFFRLDFAPSAGNFARFHLGAASSDLTAPLNGYYLQIGGTSGSADALELYRQDGTSHVLLITGTTGAVGSSPATGRVRIVRDSSGRWTLFADYDGGTSFEPEGTAVDRTYPTGRYAGFYCRYSSTRSDRFLFDELLIDPLFTDDRPPALLAVTAVSDRRLRLEFDEPLDSSVLEPGRYNISKGVGVPGEAVFRDPGATAVELTLEASLLNFEEYELTATGMRDRSGNTAGILRRTFVFLDTRPAVAGDLIITEIMADPNPPVRLPEAEFLEIYNRSNKAIPLGTLQLSNGGTPQPLPDTLFLPGEYMVLCDKEFQRDFAPFGKVLPLDGLPSLANRGDELLLMNAGGDTILQQFYSDSWYGETAKSDGGWSLERIDTEATDNCPGNWTASLHPEGGTPGRANSVAGRELESTAPRFLRVAVESPQEITLFFDEALDPELAADPEQYHLEPAVGLSAAFLQAPENRSVLLILEEALQPQVTYTVRVGAALSDCLGNASAADQEQLFGLPQEPAPGDIVINELLFHPQTGGKDFAELYNRSEKIINLEGWQLTNYQKMSGATTTIIETPFLLFPESYVVLTEDPADLRTRYEVPRPESLLANRLPTLDSDAGNLTLHTGRVTIDSFDYTDDYHSALLEDTRGVTLERIDPGNPTQDPGNWQSAAAAAGYGTPTGRNSQFTDIAGPVSDRFQLVNETFSPDGDGYEDVLLIRYILDRPGFLLNLRVFDARGRPVRTLANNLSLATNGMISWDGSSNERSKARIGIYILWFELFTPEGDVFREKKTCVLAGQLND